MDLVSFTSGISLVSYLVTMMDITDIQLSLMCSLQTQSFPGTNLLECAESHVTSFCIMLVIVPQTWFFACSVSGHMSQILWYLAPFLVISSSVWLMDFSGCFMVGFTSLHILFQDIDTIQSALIICFYSSIESKLQEVEKAVPYTPGETNSVV